MKLRAGVVPDHRPENAVVTTLQSLKIPDLRVSPASPTPVYHFSVDDVFECLIDATDNYPDLFEQPLFEFFRRMHRRFGAHVDLYLFNRAPFGGRVRSLQDVSDKFRAQFQEATWLRLGPHALEYDIPPHKQTPAEQLVTFEETYREIERFAGPEKTTGFLRLHFFSECFELAPYFLEKGAHTLLLTDKPAVAYRLDEPRRRQLSREGWLKHEGLCLLQSHFRMENLARDSVDESSTRFFISDTIARRGHVCLFTHEVDLGNPLVLAKTEESIRWAAQIAEPAGADTLLPGVAWPSTRSSANYAFTAVKRIVVEETGIQETEVQR